jgi:hypothetical protein
MRSKIRDWEVEPEADLSPTSTGGGAVPLRSWYVEIGQYCFSDGNSDPIEPQFQMTGLGRIGRNHRRALMSETEIAELEAEVEELAQATRRISTIVLALGFLALAGGCLAGVGTAATGSFVLLIVGLVLLFGCGGALLILRLKRKMDDSNWELSEKRKELARLKEQ